MRSARTLGVGLHSDSDPACDFHGQGRSVSRLAPLTIASLPSSFFFFFADEKTQNVLEGLHIQSGPGRPSEKLESVAGEKDVWNTLLSPSATTT